MYPYNIATTSGWKVVQVAASLHEGHKDCTQTMLSSGEWQYPACTDGFVDIAVVKVNSNLQWTCISGWGHGGNQAQIYLQNVELIKQSFNCPIIRIFYLPEGV